MSAVDLAVARAKVNEGFRSLPYHDTTGHLTIGYGCNLDAGWDQGLATNVLAYQMWEAEQQVESLGWYGKLDPTRQSVIVEMAFNMGLGRLLQFHKMLAALDAGDYPTAASEMLESLWASQVGARATQLATLMRGT